MSLDPPPPRRASISILRSRPLRIASLLLADVVLVFLILTSLWREHSATLIEKVLTHLAQRGGCSSLRAASIEPHWRGIRLGDLQIACGQEQAKLLADISQVEVHFDWRSFGLSSLALTGGEVNIFLPQAPPLDFSVSLQLATSDDALRGTFQIPQFALRLGQYDIPVLDWSGEFSLINQNIEVTFKARHPALGEFIGGSVSHSLETRRGALEASVKEIDFAKAGVSLSQIHPAWILPLDLTEGKLSGLVKGSWDKASEFTASVVLREGRSSFQSVEAKNIGAEASFEILPALRTVRPARVTIGNLFSPVPLTNLRTNISVVSPKEAELSEVGFEVLGGEVRIPKASFPIDGGDLLMRVPIQIENVKLAELLKLYPQEGLRAEGSIDGELELHYDSAGPAIENGKLRAREPGGVIAYELAGASAEDTPSALALSTEVLRDFRYDFLESSVAMTPQGDLTLGLSLRGRNPAWQGGRPVNLNIDLHDNLYSLWRSLQLARGEGPEFKKITGEVGASRK
jgi:hypothetical protein